MSKTSENVLRIRTTAIILPYNIHLCRAENYKFSSEDFFPFSGLMYKRDSTTCILKIKYINAVIFYESKNSKIKSVST